MGWDQNSEGPELMLVEGMEASSSDVGGGTFSTGMLPIILFDCCKHGKWAYKVTTSMWGQMLQQFIFDLTSGSKKTMKLRT
jgi:hypothetical protein